MVDPYWRYTALPSEIGGSTQKTSFHGYLSSEASTLMTHHPWSSRDAKILPSHPDVYGIDDGRGFHPEAAHARLTTGASIRGYPSPSRDSILQGQRLDVGPHIGPGMHETNYERPSSFRMADSLPVAAGDSNILSVDGLPTDCTRRESGDKAMVFCFVEFADSKCALTAMEALQGYKFDDKKPDSSVLRIHFAHFPFRPPSDHDVHQLGGFR